MNVAPSGLFNTVGYFGFRKTSENMLNFRKDIKHQWVQHWVSFKPATKCTTYPNTVSVSSLDLSKIKKLM